MAAATAAATAVTLADDVGAMTSSVRPGESGAGESDDPHSDSRRVREGNDDIVEETTTDGRVIDGPGAGGGGGGGGIIGMLNAIDVEAATSEIEDNGPFVEFMICGMRE